MSIPSTSLEIGVDFPDGPATGAEDRCKCTSCGSTARARHRKLLERIFLIAAIVVVLSQAVTSCSKTKLQRNPTTSAAQPRLKAVQRVTMPYRSPMILNVGGSDAVWGVPATPDFFEKWAAGVRFRPGDVLRFNKPNSTYIDEVAAASYASCSNAGWIQYWVTTGSSEYFIQIDGGAQGSFYFLDDDPALCNQGMRVSGSVSTLSYPGAPSQPATTTKLQGRAAQEFEVGGTGNPWVLPSSPDYFINWASNITFRVGDTLRFNINSMEYEVSLVPYASYEMCRLTNFEWYAASSAITFRFPRPGMYYFVASKGENCIQGMRFAAQVYSAKGTLESETHTGSHGTKILFFTLKLTLPPTSVLMMVYSILIILWILSKKKNKKLEFKDWRSTLPFFLRLFIFCVPT